MAPGGNLISAPPAPGSASQHGSSTYLNIYRINLNKYFSQFSKYKKCKLKETLTFS
jgi:hypothetical protein